MSKKIAPVIIFFENNYDFEIIDNIILIFEENKFLTEYSSTDQMESIIEDNLN